MHIHRDPVRTGERENAARRVAVVASVELIKKELDPVHFCVESF